MPDALDQYVVRHPQLFFGQEFEKAVLDPWNPLIAGNHLVCAAAEEPLRDEEIGERQRAGRVLETLVQESRLVQDADGTRYYSFRRRPHRDVSVRSASQPFQIVDRRSGRSMGSIDGTRVYHECHPGAVYLHGGQSFLVLELDRDRRRVVAEAARVDYYTVVLGDKETEILERLDSRSLGPFPVGLGRFKVTVRIREYQKKRLFDGEPISTHPLDVPPLIFETVGLWIELPPDLPAVYNARGLHFMGGIHATEHATIGLFPLLAIAAISAASPTPGTRRPAAPRSSSTTAFPAARAWRDRASTTSRACSDARSSWSPAARVTRDAPAASSPPNAATATSPSTNRPPC
jgi:DEAD/DEAH box helicase domain-containing protein